MLSSRLLFSLVFVPALVSAGVFPKDSLVKMLDAKTFKKAMKANETSMVAFVAPWCGGMIMSFSKSLVDLHIRFQHCQRLAPEYSKAALGLHPLLPFYAVDCDDDKNKRLCSEQGVQGFPTIKVFPKGKELLPITYDGGERTASALYYFATRRIPASFTKLYKTEDIIPWVEKTIDQKRTLLLTKDKKVPLLWKVLANKYQGLGLEFGTHRDRKGKSSVALGFEAGEKKDSKVLVYSPGSTKPFRYEGINKLDSLSKFFDSVLDGTADLTVANEEAKSEDYEPTEEELEIQRKQEAQRLSLLHGGFESLIDFEQAVMDGTAQNYHDTNGFGSPPPLKKKTTEGESDKPPADETINATPTPEPEASATPTCESHVCKNDAEL
ncbi:Protein disulfide isomerase [Mycena venus]|uniref:Protein disulfide isomerase n=1 Tax=Mycena venus TaxID=2733690 RepID=A0A8H6YBZ5_9AGAR|nr:Protein disulfide isomerase [Mycena venus]